MYLKQKRKKERKNDGTTRRNRQIFKLFSIIRQIKKIRKDIDLDNTVSKVGLMNRPLNLEHLERTYFTSTQASDTKTDHLVTKQVSKNSKESMQSRP